MQPARLVLGDVCVRLEHGRETPLLVAIVHQDHRRNPQRALAAPAPAHFTLQVLYESIREVILGPRPASGLGSLGPAVRTRILDGILERVAVQCGPSRKANTHCFGRSAAHDDPSITPQNGAYNSLDAQTPKSDATFCNIGLPPPVFSGLRKDSARRECGRPRMVGNWASPAVSMLDRDRELRSRAPRGACSA
jgi:hypothetical protein